MGKKKVGLDQIILQCEGRLRHRLVLIRDKWTNDVISPCLVIPGSSCYSSVLGGGGGGAGRSGCLPPLILSQGSLYRSDHHVL